MSFSGKIHFSPDNNEFFSGDIINGSVELFSDEDFIIHDIFFILKGKASVSWQDLDQKCKHGEIVYFMQNFESKEICVKRQMPLQHKGMLHKGLEKYNFTVKIPENIPSTLVSSMGNINYELILIIEKSLQCHKLDHKSLNIRRHLNIAQYPKLMLPFTAQFTQELCWWSCKSQPIITYVSLSSRAFKPGDDVYYTLYTENHTHSYDVERLSAFIIQTVQFKSSQPRQSIKTVLNTLNYRNHQQTCERNSKKTIKDTFRLPLDLVVSSQEETVIMVNYRFQVLVIMKGLHQDSSIVIPLTIGSHRVTTGDGCEGSLPKTECTVQIDDQRLFLSESMGTCL